MTRRETYPCARLESVFDVIRIVSNEGLVSKHKIMELGISSDDLRLAEILGIVEGKGSTNTYVELTRVGKNLLSFSEEERKMMLFWVLMRQNDIIPPYFSRLLETGELLDKRLSTRELCEKLNMKDLWSADILSEWCLHLGISEATSKSEVMISSEKVSGLKKGAFALIVKEEYKRLAGPSGLVPVAKLRGELKNSGILCSKDDFDEMLDALSKEDPAGDLMTFHAAPVRFVGNGLQGKRGYELLSIAFRKS